MCASRRAVVGRIGREQARLESARARCPRPGAPRSRHAIPSARHRAPKARANETRVTVLAAPSPGTKKSCRAPRPAPGRSTHRPRRPAHDCAPGWSRCRPGRAAIRPSPCDRRRGRSCIRPLRRVDFKEPFPLGTGGLLRCRVALRNRRLTGHSGQHDEEPGRIHCTPPISPPTNDLSIAI